MGAIPWSTIISSGADFLGGLLDDSDEVEAQSKIQSAAFGARYAYPGQKALGGKVSNYLWENLGLGLTESEKRLMRGSGRTSIMQGVKSATGDTRKQAASQGLRGGAIANILANINQSKVPAFAKLESDISSKDMTLKRERMKDILTYLGLSAGYGEDAGSSGSGNATIAGIVNSLYGSGGSGGSSGAGPGGGNAPATSSAGFDISGDTIGSVAGMFGPAGGILGILGMLGAFDGQPGNIGDMSEGGGVGATGGGGYSGGGYGMGGSEGVGGLW